VQPEDQPADAESAVQGGHRMPSHAAPEGAALHPLIDLSRDPHPGIPDHAATDDDD